MNLRYILNYNCLYSVAEDVCGKLEYLLKNKMETNGTKWGLKRKGYLIVTHFSDLDLVVSVHTPQPSVELW